VIAAPRDVHGCEDLISKDVLNPDFQVFFIKGLRGCPSLIALASSSMSIVTLAPSIIMLLVKGEPWVKAQILPWFSLAYSIIAQDIIGNHRWGAVNNLANRAVPNSLRYARLDGKVQTRQQEEDLARGLLG